MRESIYQDGTYLENRPTWHLEDSQWKANNILKIIMQNKLTAKTVCEIGCGAGEILNQLHKKIALDTEFFGYDISRQAYQLCLQREKERLRFFNEDFFKTTKDKSFDIVLAIDVVEHIEDYFGFLRKLKSRGVYKIFHIPLDLSMLSVFRVSPLMLRRKEVGHIHYFTKEMALSSLTDVGYEIIDYFFTRGSLELPRKTIKSWMSKWPRLFFDVINRDLAARIFGGYSLMILTK